MMGEWEDRWDKDVGAGVRDRGGREWWVASELARRETWGVIREEARRNLVLGEKMVGIIEEEKRLAEEERREEKRVKNQERWVRKLAKEKGTTIPNT